MLLMVAMEISMLEKPPITLPLAGVNFHTLLTQQLINLVTLLVVPTQILGIEENLK